MRTENTDLFRGPNPPGPKAKPTPQPMRPGSDAVRGGASVEARDARERFQLPDETTRSRRDHARRDDAGRPAEADPRSRAGGLGRDDAPGQLVMREVLEKLGVEGPFKAASGEAGPEGAVPGQVISDGAEGELFAEQISAEQAPAGQQVSVHQASVGEIPIGEIPPVETMLDDASIDADGASDIEAGSSGLLETKGAEAAVTAEAVGSAADVPASETGDDAALHAALLSAQGAAPENVDAGGNKTDEVVEAGPADVVTPDADAPKPGAEEQAVETASGQSQAPAGETADAAAVLAASLLAGANAGASEAGRGRRSEGGPARNGVAHGAEGVAARGAPDEMKRGALPAQASPVAAANVTFAAAAPTDELISGEVAEAAPGQAASSDDAVETSQPKPAQALDTPGLRRALGQLGMTPGQGGAIPAPAVGAGEPGANAPGAQQGLAQALSGLAEAAGKPAPTVPPAPVVPNVPLGAVPIEIGLKALSGVNHFQIRLDPAELGRIDVNLEIDTDGTVKARLTVDRVETLTLLQRDARTLERAFEQAGLKPSDGGVDLSLRDQGRNDRGGSSENGRENGRGGHSPAHENAGGSAVAKAVEPAAVHRTIWRGAAGIDVRI